MASIGPALRMGSFREEMRKGCWVWVRVASSRLEGEGYGSAEGESGWGRVGGSIMGGGRLFGWIIRLLPLRDLKGSAGFRDESNVDCKVRQGPVILAWISCPS